MINRQFDSIDKSDIDALVDNKQTERRTLEYKSELPGESDDSKREFLGDVASFANTDGGDILYGIVDERDESGKATGRPREAVGLPGLNDTSVQLRLENMIRDGIARRIAGIQIKPIAGFSKGPVILLRIPRSWAAPHMVIFKNLSRFYARNSAGKYQMDIGEIRSAFLASESLPEKIRAFRADRLAKIEKGDSPIPFIPSRAVVLHILPISAVYGNPGADVSKEANRLAFRYLAPLMSQNWLSRFNADGFLTYDDREWGAITKRSASTYVQVFRSGAMEVANQRVLIRAIPEHDETIPMTAFEKDLIIAVQRFVDFQRDIGVNPPIVLMISLLGVKNFALTTGPNSVTTSRIDRDVLMAPDILIESFDFEPDILLRPILDFFWQAAGVADCPHYGVDGRWTERGG
jgi:hypothetical protein